MTRVGCDRRFRSAVVAAKDSEDFLVELVDVEADGEDNATVVSDVCAHGIPVRFHGYERGRELGRGVSGQVFICRDTSTGTNYAVKVIDLKRSQLHANPERERKKLSREIEILNKLPPHPNIVQLFNIIEERHWFLLILELVCGGDLYTALASREPPRLKEPEAIFVACQLVHGLAFLHQQEIVHRDLKLENVLVAENRRVTHHLDGPLDLYSVKITDFGLSKSLGAGCSAAFSTVGTDAYMAPEILDGVLHDCRSDLWSLGVLIFLLLSGTFPYSQMPNTQGELKTSIERLTINSTCKSFISGLLKLQPKHRLRLELAINHNWLCIDFEDDKVFSTRPSKRQRASPIIL